MNRFQPYTPVPSQQLVLVCHFCIFFFFLENNLLQMVLLQPRSQRQLEHLLFWQPPTSLGNLPLSTSHNLLDHRLKTEKLEWELPWFESCIIFSPHWLLAAAGSDRLAVGLRKHLNIAVFRLYAKYSKAYVLVFIDFFYHLARLNH